jgi:glutathione peroxidase
MKTAFDFQWKTSQGSLKSLKDYEGKVFLIVNVASKCGYTPQYDGLEKLYKKFKDQGLVILGFPCNQFGGQEPGSNEEIQQFCQLNFGVTFPVMAKIDVNGSQAEPLFQFLKQQAPGVLGTEMIKWNFTKFLVNKQGQVIKRFAPTTEPAEIESEIQKLLTY